MSRLRISELHSAIRSVDALTRVFDEARSSPLLQLIEHEPEPHGMTASEMLALFTIRASSVSLEVAARLRDEGVTLTSDAFRSVRDTGLACRAQNGFHELTAKGRAKTDVVAAQCARDRAMHVLTYRTDRGHIRQYAEEIVRCTCSWHRSTRLTRLSNLRIQQYGAEHLASVATYITDSPSIVPGRET